MFSNSKNRNTIAAIVALAAIAAFVFSTASCNRRQNGEKNMKECPLGFDEDEYFMQRLSVVEGDCFTSMMARCGVSDSSAYALSRKCGGIFDVTRIRAGAEIHAYYSDSLQSAPSFVVYCNNRIRSTIFQCKDSLAIWTYDRPVELEHKVADVTIKSSLWNDMLAQGTSPLLIVELADIYAWTVNFFALQEGDRFRAIYDQSVCGGEVVRIDSILFCIYDSGDFHSTAVRLKCNGESNRYWNEKGESMRKAFLKAPLRYNRISSRFTYHRRHPITGKVRAHTAVDYAAPKGTPVQSIGDGIVTLCGWDPSGGGNRIKIKHMNGYETSYMHLSGFAKGVRSGTHVVQGQTIGYVGSTGHSTGPHLDFRVWKDRTPIDPLRMIAPPAKPLDASLSDSLAFLVKKYSEELKNAENIAAGN